MPIDVMTRLPAEAIEVAKTDIGTGFRLTELGNAERLVARNKDSIHYCGGRRKWLVYDGTRWVWDVDGEMDRRAKQSALSIYEEAAFCTDDDKRKKLVSHAKDSERSAKINAVLSLASTEPGVPVQLSELDANLWQLNCKNGTIDLQSGSLKPHNRADAITRMANVDFDPDARSEIWENFILESTGGDMELANYLQRAVGYALQGGVTARAFFFIYGPPGTAKSTFIEAISSALGDYHQSASSDTWLQQTNVGGNRGDLVRLASARLVTSSEVKKGAKFDEATIKSITGGDLITAAAKYEAEVTFKPQMTLWIAANDAPTIRDDDAGMWARVKRCRRAPRSAVRR